VPEHAVVNASPLIFLSRANVIELLRLSAGDVVVPAPVYEELSRRGASDDTTIAIEKTPWIRVVPAPERPASILSWDLGDGESSVLAWALANPGSEVIIDDLAARRCAAALRIDVRGTLGLVLLGKRNGRLERARPVLEVLRASGMYLSDDIVNRALELVGE
jgi:predicted nucleic acid-binding protein